MLEVGYVAERQELLDRLVGAGFQGIRQRELFAMLGHFCDPKFPVLTPRKTNIITDVGINSTLENWEAQTWLDKALFRGFSQIDKFTANPREYSDAPDYISAWRSADSLPAAGSVVVDAFVRKLSKALSMPVKDIEVQKPLHAYGVDSHVALEIRFWISKEFKTELDVLAIVASSSIYDLGMLVVSKFEYTNSRVKEE